MLGHQNSILYIYTVLYIYLYLAARSILNRFFIELHELSVQ